MTAQRAAAGSPYPPDWEAVAELRVFKTTPERWDRLIKWRNDMKAKGWRLLKVTEFHGELTAIFGRTREELLSRQHPNA